MAELDVGAARSKLLLRTRRQVDRLWRLVANLLDVSRISEQRLDLQLATVDLPALVRDVVDQFAADLARAGSPVKLEAPECLVGRWDPLRLAQILTNLLSNACRFGRGKPIEISVSADGGLARVVVRDHGIGISPKDRERVFQRYERAALSRQDGGLGLGLYITRQLIEAHGGSIQVSSELGAGSTFSVSLPLQPHGEEVIHVAPGS
jgi:signal transduction histidine kinase